MLFMKQYLAGTNKVMLNKKIQTGILIGLLILPVFLYLILASKDRGKFAAELPILGPRVLSESGDTIYHTIKPFRFIDAGNKVITDLNFEGSIYVADFVFTQCKSICPKMSTGLSRVQEYYKDESSVKLLSHTVDPDYDKGQVLLDYAAKYNAIKDKWFFITGDKQAIYDMAIKSYFVVAGEEDSEVGFVHSEKLVLIDKENQIRGFYDGTSKEEVERLVLEIKVLLEGYE